MTASTPTPPTSSKPTTKATKPVVTAVPVKVVKQGWKTTEFWVMIAANVGAISAAAADVLPDRYAALLAAVSTAGYSISRGLTKH